MKYDAIIIGSGQGGNPLSYRLAELGWQVALIEKRYVGGTCINTGCTPTKTMVHRAQVAHYARNASRWGVHAENVFADLPTIVAQKNKVVTSYRGGIQKKIGLHPNIQFFEGHAKFTNAHQIQVGDDFSRIRKDFHQHGLPAKYPCHFGARSCQGADK